MSIAVGSSATARPPSIDAESRVSSTAASTVLTVLLRSSSPTTLASARGASNHMRQQQSHARLKLAARGWLQI